MNDGSIHLKLLYEKQELIIPLIVILKALIQVSDAEIYNRIVKGHCEQNLTADRVEGLLNEAKTRNLYSQDQCLAYLGTRLRVVMRGITDNMPDKEVGEFFINNFICVQTKDHIAKFECLCMMATKLYAVVNGEAEVENPDTPAMQEVLLSGHLYANYLSEKIFDLLHINLKVRLIKELRRANYDALKFRDINFLKRIMETSSPIGKKMENFLATGNL